MVRLSTTEIQAIKSSVYESLPDAELYLFGSRADDSKRGGDIDLLVYSPNNPEPDLTTKSKIHYSILEKIGEQKLDIIFTTSLSKTSFIEHAFASSTKL